MRRDAMPGNAIQYNSLPHGCNAMCRRSAATVPPLQRRGDRAAPAAADNAATAENSPLLSCLCFLFFDVLGLKEDSPSSNKSRFFQNIPRCSSFFGCCSSLGFSNEVNSQFLTAIATNIIQISKITNKLAYSPTIDLLTNGGQRHLSEVDI